MRVTISDFDNSDIYAFDPPWNPYIGEKFDRNNKTYTIKDISIDLMNAKMFIYVREG
jgi:hypothetical protein